MTKLFSLLALAFVLSVARAAPIATDLGLGLAYHRVHALPADLPSAQTLQGQPCVLDLRYTTGDTAAATALAAWLKFHATARTPVFVLANAGTASALLNVLVKRDAFAGLIVLGAPAPGFTPDLAIAAANERTAYDAAETGTPLDQLVTTPVDKPRNDEAKLARERQAETPTPPAEAEVPSPTPVTAAKPAAPPPLIDLVLQRAVQLHRTLLALKKI
jgi:hypothetical protein